MTGVQTCALPICFPLDLTQLIAREYGLSVNAAEFDREMQVQKDRSRNAAVQETDDWVELKKIEKVEFVGYTDFESDTKIARYRKVTQKGKTYYQLVLERTPFYAESGGQVGDTGYLQSDSEMLSVVDTQKENNLVIHIVNKLPVIPEAAFRAVVNLEARQQTENNHTATHLLDHALREILGKHVEQKGSLVHPDYLRFDFSHFGKVTHDELDAIQKMVNKMIRQNLSQDEMAGVSFDAALEMGAIALFGEKYGDTVRVIRFGDSIELCGGTHVHSTGQIGQFIILSESAISAGIRRIEAITGDRADQYIREKLDELAETRALFSQTSNLRKSVESLMEENARLRKQIGEFERKAASGIKEELKRNMEQLGDVNVIAAQASPGSAQAVKDLAYQLKSEISNLFLVLGVEIEGKPSLTVMISEELVKSKGLDAGKIVREAGKEIKGGGGGQPFYATAGGKDVSGLPAAIAKAKSFILAAS